MAPIPDHPAPPLRVADVHLRGPAPRARARVYWPPAGASRPALVVAFTPPSAAEGDAPVDRLVDRLGAVVLAVAAEHVVAAHAALTWAADHAGELGADPDRLAVVGVGSAAALAERVVELAVDEGWPPLRHVALVRPPDDPRAALDRLATALARPAGSVR
jgi:acetyl esterase/lipase